MQIYYVKNDQLLVRDTTNNPVFEEVVLSISPNTIIYINDTGVSSITGAFFFVSCSWADSTSICLSASNAISAAWAPSQPTLSSSFASFASSASFAITSAFALNSVGGSGTTLFTASTYQITSSNAISASFAVKSHTADAATSSSFATRTISSSYAQAAGSADSSSYSTNNLSSSFSLASHNADAAISASFSTRNLSSSFALSSANSDTASYATTGQSASYALNASNAGSASFANHAITASFSLNSANADTASFSNRTISSSFALSAASADSASFSTRNISSSFALTAHLSDSSSYSTNTLSSSFALAAHSSDTATSASFATAAHLADSASYATNALSSSFGLSAHLADSASYSTNTLTSSFALAAHQADSASFATTAAFAMNGGGGATVSNRLVWYPMVQGLKVQQNNAITQSEYEIPGGFIDDYEDVSFISASGPFTQFNSTGGYINNIAVNAPASGDIYYFSCSLIYPFNGVNGAKGTTDYSVNNFSASFNNAQIDSSTFETGTSSLLCSATPFNLEIPSGLAGTSFDIATNQDFTIEGWYKWTTINANDTMWCMGPAAPLLWAISDTSLYFRLEDSPFSRDHQTATGVISTGPWYHIAFTRQGTGANNCTVWVNGVSKLTFSDNGPITRMGNFTLGYLDASSNGGFAHNGWIDDFRWTVGVARYSASFDTASLSFFTTPFTGSTVGGGKTGSLISNFRTLNYSPTTTYAVLPVKVYSGSFNNFQVGITTDSGSTYASMSLVTESAWIVKDPATKVFCGAFTDLNTGSNIGYKITIPTGSLIVDVYGIGLVSL